MIKKHILTLALALVLILGFMHPAFSQELSVRDIVEKANLTAYYKGAEGRSNVKMTITDSQGRVRNREFTILRFDVEEGGAQKFYTYFRQPVDVAKMVYMVWKYKGNDDDRWLYMPALDLVRRIASGDKRTSFVGSHYLYEDISGRDIDDDNHEIVENANEFYKLKSTPKEGKGVEFAYFYSWIDKNTFLPKKFEYYNDKDVLIRTIEALEEKVIQGHPTVTKSMAKDFDRGGNTVIEFLSIEYDIGLTDDIFAERYLRKPPIQWIK